MNNIGNNELVSVIMSVYKADVKLIDRAIKSILNQSYVNIEYIIIDDGAGEDALHYLENLKDNRVVLIHNKNNIGLAASLNKAIDLAKGKYIARMDADDYSCKDRIRKQYEYMEKHSDVDVLACIAMDIMNDCLTGGIGGAYRKLDSEIMKIELSLAPKTFPHPTVMFRKSFLQDHNLRYDESFKRAQDYDMWAQCSLFGKLDSLQKPLLLYDQGESCSTEPSKLQVFYSNETKLKCLKRLIPDATDAEKSLYIHFRDLGMYGTPEDNIKLLNKLLKANKQKKIYNTKEYSLSLYFWWGRKILYPQNRSFFVQFLGNGKFMIGVLGALILKTWGHVFQIIYEKKMVKKIMKEGICSLKAK